MLASMLRLDGGSRRCCQALGWGRSTSVAWRNWNLQPGGPHCLLSTY